MDMKRYTQEEWDADANRRRYPNIFWSEVSCSTSGQCHVDRDFLDQIQVMRTELGFSMTFSSIYRSDTHPVEVAKLAKGKQPGSHFLGCAVDVKCSGQQALMILHYLIGLRLDCELMGEDTPITGIGVSQKGKGRFIHIDGMNEKECNSLGLFEGWQDRFWSY